MTGLMVRSAGTIRTTQLAFREVGWQRLGWLERELERLADRLPFSTTVTCREVGWHLSIQ
jgi:hypothetical protein